MTAVWKGMEEQLKFECVRENSLSTSTALGQLPAMAVRRATVLQVRPFNVPALLFGYLMEELIFCVCCIPLINIVHDVRGTLDGVA